MNSREKLGDLIKANRELRGWSQDEVVKKIEERGAKVNRSIVAHLEQGLRIPKPELLQSIAEILQVPTRYWQHFASKDSLQRFEFEEVMAELVGFSVTLDGHDESSVTVVEKSIADLFEKSASDRQTLDRLNSILVFYGPIPITEQFFSRYFTAQAFSSTAAFERAIKGYQEDAVRLFSTLAEAYRQFNTTKELRDLLAPIQPQDIKRYTERREWDDIEEIPDDRLPDLGYISAARVKQESKERETLKKFLEGLAEDIRKKGKLAIEDISTKQRKRMDSLLRKFESKIPHGLFSPLFAPDPDELVREAARIAPKTEQELARMQTTQETAMRNLARYLAADYLDLYVATSMRSDADFVSVNHFVRTLFKHERVRSFKLRFFNPTQSWVDDRIAKGLVEALMLRRADVTIYMAQKSDTFGKDSEASVALGQGKPVIVYVPKLILPDGTDTERLFKRPRAELISLLDEADRSDIDDTVDDQVIVSRILHSCLEKVTDDELGEIARQIWADFDLHAEADRIEDPNQKPEATGALRADYRKWLDAVLANKQSPHSFKQLRPQVIGIFVANAIRFEQRAKVFREIHPLALQVILSSGVLNGIIVGRSVDHCAEILANLIQNDLKLELTKDENNYRLIEKVTGSTIRVVSRHRLLRHAFQNFYGRL